MKYWTEMILVLCFHYRLTLKLSSKNNIKMSHAVILYINKQYPKFVYFQPQYNKKVSIHNFFSAEKYLE